MELHPKLGILVLRKLLYNGSDDVEFDQIKRGEGSLHPRLESLGIRDPPHSQVICMAFNTLRKDERAFYLDSF